MRNILRKSLLDIVGLIRKPAPGIHIINSHFVSPASNVPDSNQIFYSFLMELRKYCVFLRIEDAVKFIKSGNIPNDECYVAFTFDDAFQECYDVIAPLLESFDANAAFFVNPNFVECNLEYHNEFSSRSFTNGKKSMTWKNLIDLHNRGHVIGSHTMDHVNLGDTSLTKDDLNFQIAECRREIEKIVGNNCNWFAFPYGQMKNINKASLEIMTATYDVVFSGTNYKNYFSENEKIINRRHLEPDWPKSHIKYFLSFNKK